MQKSQTKSKERVREHGEVFTAEREVKAMCDLVKKELTQEEKEYKSMRKQIQEKLIKFATRVPIFMYLTDYRERSLKDVITQLEPGLFKKVTGLGVNDFNLLSSIGVFNASLMNDAIFKFKRYEDSSLSYTGIEKSVSTEVGGWDTVIRRKEHEKLFYNQQATMTIPKIEVAKEHIEEAKTPIVEKKIAPKSPTFITTAYGVNSPVTTTVQKAKEVPKPEIDLSSAVVGTRVVHKKFGEGTISNIDKAQKYIKIAFSVGEKMFVFPTCFEQGFLTIK